ncbi:unnamed protein product, partial [Rhizophagus irregularis]
APVKTEKPLPFLFHFTAGGIAGTSEILVMYPLDVVKTTTKEMQENIKRKVLELSIKFRS